MACEGQPTITADLSIWMLFSGPCGAEFARRFSRVSLPCSQIARPPVLVARCRWDATGRPSTCQHIPQWPSWACRDEHLLPQFVSHFQTAVYRVMSILLRLLDFKECSWILKMASCWGEACWRLISAVYGLFLQKWGLGHTNNGGTLGRQIQCWGTLSQLGHNSFYIEWWLMKQT